MIVSLDFRAGGIENRLGVLDGEPGEHVALAPPVVPASSLDEYVDALVAPVPPNRTSVVVTYCAAFGLAAPVARAIERRGGTAAAVVALDPLVPTAADVGIAYRDVVAQLEAAGAAPAIAPPIAVGARLAAHVDALVSPVALAVEVALGTADDPSLAPLAAELTQRYATWLRHVLACYAGAAQRLPAPPVALCSLDHDPTAAAPSRVVRFPGDVLDQPALRDAVLAASPLASAVAMS